MPAFVTAMTLGIIGILIFGTGMCFGLSVFGTGAVHMVILLKNLDLQSQL